MSFRAVRFSVPGKPVTWKRAAHGGRRGHKYTPDEQRAHMELVRWFYKSAGGPRFPEDMPLVFSGRFWFQRPPEHWSKRTDELKDWAVPLLPMSKHNMDLSNLMKLPEDALNEIGYWDDVQIVAYEPRPERLYLPGKTDEPRSDFILAPMPGWLLPSGE